MSKDNFVNDPNYGSSLHLCVSGEAHLDGEACNCQPQVQKQPVAHLGIDPFEPAPGDGAYARREDPDSSIQDIVEFTSERYRSISPRFAPLRRKDLIYVSGKKKASQTGRIVLTWRAA